MPPGRWFQHGVFTEVARTTFALSLAVASLLLCERVRAQTESEEVEREAIVQETSVGDAYSETAYPGWTYPKGYGQRPLVMDKHMVRATFGIDVKRPTTTSGTGSGALVALDLGGAFSPLDHLEVGVSNYRLGSSPPKPSQGLVPLVVAPGVDFGDIAVYTRYSFLRKDYVEIAADAVFVLPSNTNFAFVLGVPVRIQVRPKVTIDTGMEVTALTRSPGANLDLPVRGTFNITPAGFVFGESGFSFQNLGRNGIRTTTESSVADSNVTFPIAKNQVFVPLSVGGGYTVVIRGKVMLDVFGRFGWNPFLYLNAPSSVNVVPARESWFLGVGTIIHTRPVGRP